MIPRKTRLWGRQWPAQASAFSSVKCGYWTSLLQGPTHLAPLWLGARPDAAQAGRGTGGRRETWTCNCLRDECATNLKPLLLTIGESTPIFLAQTWRPRGRAPLPPSVRPRYLSPCLVLEGGECRTVWFPSISTTHLVFSSSSASKGNTDAAKPSIPPARALPGGGRAGHPAPGSARPVRASPPPGSPASAARRPPSAAAPRPRSFQSCPRPRPDPGQKEAERSSPRRFMGRTRTATFTFVSDMLAAPARPEAAPHAPRRRRRRRAPLERGRRRSAESSARQRRGARAIPGERDAGHGRGPGRGGRGAGRGGRGGGRARARAPF